MEKPQVKSGLTWSHTGPSQPAVLDEAKTCFKVKDSSAGQCCILPHWQASMTVILELFCWKLFDPWHVRGISSKYQPNRANNIESYTLNWLGWCVALRSLPQNQHTHWHTFLTCLASCPSSLWVPICHQMCRMPTMAPSCCRTAPFFVCTWSVGFVFLAASSVLHAPLEAVGSWECPKIESYWEDVPKRLNSLLKKQPIGWEMMGDPKILGHHGTPKAHHLESPEE